MSTESDAEKQQPGIPVPWEPDPENPQNWNTGRKALNLGIDSTLGFITSPLESSVIVPGVPLLKEDFHETRPPVTSLVVSIFVLSFAFGPLLLSPLSELYGRRLLLNICNVVTLGFSIGSALAPNIATFIVFRRLDVFRFIAGSFGAGPMNIGGGSIADQVELPKRSFVMSIFFTEYEVHWIVPIIFTGFSAAGLIFSFLPTQIYMIDAFTAYAASALAATSVIRSIVGGFLPIAGLPLYSALGYGWGNSLLGFIAIVVSIAPLLFWRYGETLRKRYNVQFD
ncbi:multidrug resistant protein [Fusarium mexicanum]|uniref:Multidrug resistant protein n=1 Tax=Fusarium mexicanum TaxID=751941 RepID=A0A8H5MN83_9HYPO|nr:multidrug resistant protein [Fusarium mexicanum]